MALALLLLWALAGTADARVETIAKGVPATIIFPVVGPTSYTDDFGDPRGQGRHEGNDLIAAWKTPVVAVEPGKVQIYTASSSAGCMLYLFGASGTTYIYIHLNNDLTAKNDNNGSCKPGIAYAEGLKTNQKVRGGQLVGYVGDSGDANGVGTHLHFELHPGDRGAVSPYKWLRRANHLLFPYSPAFKRGAAGAATLTLDGTVTAVSVPEPPAQPPDPVQPTDPTDPGTGGTDAGAGVGTDPGTGNGDGTDPGTGGEPQAPSTISIKVTSVTLSVGGKYRVTKTVTITVPADAILQRIKAGGPVNAKIGSVKVGEKVTVTTAPIQLTLNTQLGKPGTMTAARAVFRKA